MPSAYPPLVSDARASDDGGKTPAPGAAFWITLLGACAMGETAGDLLSHGLKLGYALSSILLGVVFLVAIGAELRGERFSPLRYWCAIVATATVGTTLADLISRTLDLGYARASLGLVALLLVVLAAGWRLAGRGAEVTYWLAILVISTLGTTLGDYASNESGLGFGGTALALGAGLLVVLGLRSKRIVPERAGFWTAVLLTSTFGAAAGDWLTKDEGLRLGPFLGTLALALVLAAIVAGTRLSARRAVGG